MLFANPFMLWGLFAISIPIIIHLFNLQRYKKVYFTNVRFLKQLKQQSRRQSVLRHWLALLFRILAIIALVLAFSKPFIPTSVGNISDSGGIASIYIDNSFSMGAEGREGLLINEAINKARTIKDNHSRSDKFNFLTNDFLAVHHRMFSADELADFIDEVDVSPAIKDLRDVLNRQYDLLNSESGSNKTVYLISDFQRNVSSFEGLIPDTNMRHFMLHLEPVRQTNLSVDTCWFETPAQQPGQIVTLNVTITNHSDSPREQVPVKLIVNGTQRALTSIDINPRESATGSLSFSIRETGIHQGFVELSDYPVTFDDRLYFSFQVLSSINVLSIFDQSPGPYLRALYGNDSLFNFTETNVRQLNYAELNRQQLIILNGLNTISSGLASELGRFVESGGSLFIIPSSRIDQDSYNSWLRSLNSLTFGGQDTTRLRMADVNILHPLFKDVFETQAGKPTELSPDTDLPWVSKRYKFVLPPRKSIETLISLKDADPYLVADSYGEGNIYIMASSLETEATTFPVHAIFVPTLYKMALLSTPRQDIYNKVGTQESVSIGNLSPGSDQVFQLSASDGNFRFIPGHRTINYNTHLFALDAIKTAGNYHLTAGQDTLLVLSFNYDRRESVPDYLSVEELYDMAENTGITNFAVISESERPVGQVISELNRGRQLWKYFIIAALFFLLAEIAALRFLP
ncbi:MAG: BatA domain-containing protein [Bacteroidales bacterium]|nr:BatA domain-containing protein [Bacteroidales bacterium]